MQAISKIEPDNRAMQTPLTQDSVQAGLPVNAHLPVSEKKKQQWYLLANAGAETSADRHLRSGVEELRYSVFGPDSEVLRSNSDLILSADTLAVQYLVVDTGKWLLWRLVVIDPQRLK